LYEFGVSVYKELSRKEPYVNIRDFLGSEEIQIHGYNCCHHGEESLGQLIIILETSYRLNPVPAAVKAEIELFYRRCFLMGWVSILLIMWDSKSFVCLTNLLDYRLTNVLAYCNIVLMFMTEIGCLSGRRFVNWNARKAILLPGRVSFGGIL
jgi:hypothetical protein